MCRDEVRDERTRARARGQQQQRNRMRTFANLCASAASLRGESAAPARGACAEPARAVDGPGPPRPRLVEPKGAVELGDEDVLDRRGREAARVIVALVEQHAKI